MSNNEFIKEFNNKYNVGISKLPSNIGFEFIDDEKIIKLTLGASAVANNMQVDGSAFEGWTIILLSYCKNEYRIKIDIEDGFEEKRTKYKGHFNRFLYRIRKFDEQFREFIIISKKLNKYKDEFFFDEKPISYNEYDLTFNYPSAEASTEKETSPENLVEIEFATNQNLSEDLAKATENIFKDVKFSNPINIYRQLPVGVFVNEVKQRNAIFTGKKSAIDLWAMPDEETMCIYELKTDNLMTGIITELYFYANLMSDIYSHIDNEFILDKKALSKQKQYRGFDNLYKGFKKIKKIKAMFLSNELHPLIKGNLAEIIKLLNYKLDETHIEYGNIEYEYKYNGITIK